jgi:hypothetical protein
MPLIPPGAQRLLRSANPWHAAPPAMATLLQGALWFWCADILYTGFASAYAYSIRGVHGVLAYLFATQAVIVLAYLLNLHALHRRCYGALQGYRGGVAAMFASLVAAGLLESDLAVLAALAAIGGAGRGAAFGARIWLELHHTQSTLRERYLGLSEAAGALLRLLIPLGASLLLALMTAGTAGTAGPETDNYQVLFLGAGLLGLAGLAACWGGTLDTPAPGPVRLRQPYSSRAFWASAPFFVVDGAGLALRTALFVSGAMAVVGSAAGYGMVEAGGSCCAIGLLLWRARHAAAEPSLPRLRLYLAVLGLGWVMLLVALRYPLALPVFIAAYALATPLVAMVKGGLNLKGLVLPGIAPQDAMASRMLLFSAGRMLAMGIGWLATSAAVMSAQNIVLLAGLALLLLPLEYHYSKALNRAAPSP